MNEITFLRFILDKIQNGMTQVATPSEFEEILVLMTDRIETLVKEENSNA